MASRPNYRLKEYRINFAAQKVVYDFEIDIFILIWKRETITCGNFLKTTKKH